MTTHNQKVEAARRAIRVLHADTSVSPETTRESLEELRADIDAMVEAIEDDLEEDDRR